MVLAANAMRVMDKVIGIAPLVYEAGYKFDAIDIYTEGSSNFDKVGGFKLSDENTRCVTIGRPVLHEILLDGCREYEKLIDVRYSAKLMEIKESDEGVTAVLEDKSEIRGESFA